VTSRPTGVAPPEDAALPDGERLDLVLLAREICRRYRDEFPDEDERYGEAGNEWCRHDNRYILSWAALALRGYEDFDARIDWLAGVLGARDFPLDRLARDLEIAADVVPELDDVLRAGAERVRSA
jgi:hypothetical protein